MDLQTISRTPLLWVFSCSCIRVEVGWRKRSRDDIGPCLFRPSSPPYQPSVLMQVLRRNMRVHCRCMSSRSWWADDDSRLASPVGFLAPHLISDGVEQVQELLPVLLLVYLCRAGSSLLSYFFFLVGLHRAAWTVRTPSTSSSSSSSPSLLRRATYRSHDVLAAWRVNCPRTEKKNKHGRFSRAGQTAQKGARALGSPSGAPVDSFKAARQAVSGLSTAVNATQQNMPGDVPRAHEDIGVDELAAGLGLAGGGSDAAGDQQQQALLSDGYFSRSDEAGRSGRQNACRGRGFSSQVPHVPDRWVSDPSLAQGSSPFAADRQLNRNLSSTSSSSPSSSSSSAFLPLNPNQHHHHQHHHHHRRDLHEDHHKYNNTHDFYARPQPQPQPHTYNQPHFTPRYPARRPPPPAATPLLFPPPAPRPRRSPSAYSERSSLFSEAPPAYTPSPTTAATAFPHNYQTLSPASPLSSSSSSPPNMGRSSESEARGLLVGQTYHEIPQSMGGDPDQPDEDEFTYPRPTLRERIRRFSFRRQWKMVLLVVLLFLVTIGFLATSILGIKDQVSL